MDWLRITLILSGIALVAGIYLWERRKQRRSEALQRWQEPDFDLDTTNPDPLTADNGALQENWQGGAIKAERRTVLGDEALMGLQGLTLGQPLDDSALPAFGGEGEGAAGESAPEEAVMILSLLAKADEHFPGGKLRSALEEAGLQFGEMGIYHYREPKSGKTLFSAANILEPGTFEPQTMEETETPGLALFMRLPAPLAGEAALRLFVQQAKALKEALGGTIYDAHRQPLTKESLNALKETAARFPAQSE